MLRVHAEIDKQDKYLQLAKQKICESVEKYQVKHKAHFKVGCCKKLNVMHIQQNKVNSRLFLLIILWQVHSSLIGI